MRLPTLFNALALLAIAAASAWVLPGAANAATPFARIDPAPFMLDPADSFQRYGSVIDELESSGKVRKAPTLSSALDGPQDFKPTWGLCHGTGITAGLDPTGFCWDARDDGWDTANWRPQGISGSWDAQPSGLWENRRITVASWHGIKDSDAFGRLTFVDFTSTGTLKFRDVLLVVPVRTATGVTFTTFNWNHADGVVWYGNTLLVANGGRLHAFRLTHLWAMDRSAEDIGLGPNGDQPASARWHRYALPMVGEYYPEYTPAPGSPYVGCSSITGVRPCMNSISLDRRGSARDSMVSAEFVGPNQAGGRAFRWPMDYTTALPALSADGKVHAEEAFTSPIWHMQGVASDGTNWFLSGTCAGGTGTCVHKAAANQAPSQKTRVYGGLENLSYQPVATGQAARLWGINEGNERFVFSIKVP
ncbi:hypothetical protein [Virgisporangium aurantiacum]|uniref:Secreted protein n=1 Tax=Virgisporangium aurantiacum TaxID=175570 RepID=A0A8J3ZI04_9ACTN|nr:hypothetical protein [Virgisporangium aurantiacum]GIJ64259.1 hypothetical protein Vau01_117750 [Virgisporangium aurantiacum]